MGNIHTRICGAVAIILLSCGVGFAQTGLYGPGVNPSNPQDLSRRSNPQDLTLPGGSNPQDLVRAPPSVRPLSRPAPNLGQAPPVSSSFTHTHIDQPIEDQPTQKPAKKSARRKHRVTNTQDQ